jgi:predicted O-linked N-acetylglucosamine transferase (SPINDLY family)
VDYPAEILERAKQLHGAGQLPAAVPLYHQVLEADPANGEAYFLLAAAQHGLGQLSEAVASLRNAVRVGPDVPAAHSHLGIVLSQQGHLDEAIDCLRNAIRLAPDSPDIAHNLQLLLAERARREVALGNRFLAQDQNDDAAVCFRRALELNPENAEAHNNLGTLAGGRGDLPEAAECYCRAVQAKPDHFDAHRNLGIIYERLGRLSDAVASFRRAVELRPDSAGALQRLGIGLRHLGRMDDALDVLRRAVRLDPSHAIANSTMLLTMQYHQHASLEQLAAAHREFEQRHGAPLRSAWPIHQNDPDPERRLRVGFVSADLGTHPVGYFLMRVLQNLDPGQVETICYSDRQGPDLMTEQLRAMAAGWRHTVGQSDEQLAQMILSDRIDILFDLAGHTGNNRLLAFARKPAPLAVTWAGYVGTTGLEAMDYLLADRHQVLASAEPFIRERVLRMPDGYVCYDPPDHAPPVASLPALSRGHVTFGSLNNVDKITSAVVEVWATILRRTAGSRLVLKNMGMDDPAVIGRLHEEFARHGVDAARLELQGWSAAREALAEYGRLDIALDPFPYNGGLTTCEALWMGVPVITCPGETFAARHGVGHLSNVGLAEMIAPTLDEYVERAVALAADLPALAALRAGLRHRVAASPLCDGQRFADNLASVLRGAWRQWCADRLNTANG